MSVGASGITIDLKGFTLRGDGSGLDHGIDDKVGGFDGLTVKNGVIVNFVDGIHAGGDVGGDADHVSVSEVVVSGNTAGISIEGDFATVQSVSASGNGDGVYVDGDMASIKSLDASGNFAQGLYVVGDSLSVKTVTASGNGQHGVLVLGDFAKIQSVTASGNDFHGIRFLQGEAALLKGNTTNGNGSPGGVSQGGRGIFMFNFTIPPVGTNNTARGNDDPTECTPTYLC